MNVYDHPLFQAQLDLEEEMRSMGIERYRQIMADAKENGSETRVGSVRTLLSQFHMPIVEGIKEFIDECKAGAATRNGVAFKIISELDPDVMAHLALRVVLDKISSTSTLNDASIEIGTMIEDELHYEAFKDEHEKDYKYALTKAKASASDSYRRRHMKEIARKIGVGFREWGRQDRLRVGLKLIEIIIAKTGMVTAEREIHGGTNSPVILRAAEGTLEWLQQQDAILEALSPTYMPTIVPPKPWGEGKAGGYWSGRVRRLRFVKSRGKAQKAEDMPLVAEAVNSVQNTAWRINTKVLDVVEQLYSMGVTHSVIPEPDKLDLPVRPVWLKEDMKVEEMTEAQAEEFNAWKKETAQTHSANAELTHRRITFSRKLMIARKFRDREAIYFPHTLDFRGRMYPVPLYLHPQGDDLCKALLCFSEGMPIGNEEGVKWLSAHLAGSFGVDKVDFADRMAWVKKHEQDILAVASDPLVNTWWATAEKPWLALAACYEWAGYLKHGLDYVSHLSVQMDGSCNGLQHFSALLRDAIGGAAVNLVPGDKPADIYSQVASVVQQMVERDVFHEDEAIAGIAKGWLGNVSRKVVKRPVMTLAYGAKKYGYSQMVFNDTISPWKASSPSTFPFKSNGWHAAQYMAGLIWEAVGEVVVAARQAMDWLQEVAGIAAKAGLGVRWTTPDGFVCSQIYRLPLSKRLELTFMKARLRLTVIEGDLPKLDSAKQRNGIAPNYIHSLDATHCRNTVRSAARAGIKAFSLIHDSYGTHAANCGTLAAILREQFLFMYVDSDLLTDFRNEVMDQLPGLGLPLLPPKGTLSLAGVLDSDFFFA